SRKPVPAKITRSAALPKPSTPDIALDDMGISPWLIRPASARGDAAEDRHAFLRRFGGGSGPPFFYDLWLWLRWRWRTAPCRIAPTPAATPTSAQRQSSWSQPSPSAHSPLQ